jgi:hypothetical protein
MWKRPIQLGLPQTSHGSNSASDKQIAGTSIAPDSLDRCELFLSAAPWHLTVLTAVARMVSLQETLPAGPEIPDMAAATGRMSQLHFT